MKIISLIISIVLCASFCVLIVEGNACTSSTCMLGEYIDDLNYQISQITCLESKLSSAVIALNGTTIYSTRFKQLQKVLKTKNQLLLELNTIKDKCTSNPSMCYPSLSVGPSIENSTLGKRYSDGSYASSCYSYRYPQSPYVYNNEGSGFYQIKNGSSVYSVYCDMETMGGGWTLVMKTSSNSAYSYSNAVWTNTDVTLQKNLSSLTMDEDYVSPAFYKLNGNETMLAMANLQYSNSWFHSVGTPRDLSNGLVMATTYITTDTCASQTNCGFQPINKKPLGIWQAMPYNYITSHYFRFGYANVQVPSWGSYFRIGFSTDGDQSDSSDTAIGLGIDCNSGCGTSIGTVNHGGSGFYAYKPFNLGATTWNGSLRGWLWIRG